MNLRLAGVLLLTLFTLGVSTSVNAQSAPIVLVPDSVTGEVVFKLNTSTDDVRLDRTCIYRLETGEEVACLPVSAGRPPAAEEAAPNGEGVVLEIPATVSILAETQTFGARNIAFENGIDVFSGFSANSAILSFAVVAPMFIVQGSE